MAGTGVMFAIAERNCKPRCRCVGRRAYNSHAFDAVQPRYLPASCALRRSTPLFLQHSVQIFALLKLKAQTIEMESINNNDVKQAKQ